MTDVATDAASRSIDAAANTDNTVVVARCSTPETRCMVCWLRAQIAADPETKVATFRTGELEVNLVGIRRAGSISDAFDDLICVFYRLALPEDRALFDQVIERDLRDEWASNAFAKAQDRTRLVACGKDAGLWAVALYDKISTDPGLTELDEEKLAKARLELDAKLAKKRREVEVKDTQVTEAQAALDDKTAARKAAQEAEAKAKAAKEAEAKAAPPVDAKAKPPAKPAKLPKPKAPPPDPKDVELARLQKAQGKLVAERDKLAAEQAALEGQQQDNAKALEAAKAEAAKAPIAVIGDDREGGLAPGRAMLPGGVYDGAYQVGVHHLRSGEHFHNAHVAMVIGFTPGYRFYAASYLRSAAWQGGPNSAERKAVKDVERIVVGIHLPNGATTGTKFAGTDATLVETKLPAGTVDVAIDDNGTIRPVAPGDVVALRARIGGTNLHRGHNIRLAGTMLADCGGGSHVSTWSEGCQVNQSFAHYNQFIRSCAIGKRFRCAQQHHNAGAPGCARLTVGSGAALGAGEQAVLRAAGEDTLSVAAARAVDKRLAARKAELARLQNKRTAWTPAKQAELDKLREPDEVVDEPVEPPPPPGQPLSKEAKAAAAKAAVDKVAAKAAAAKAAAAKQAAIATLIPLELTPADQVALDADVAEVAALESARTQLGTEKPLLDQQDALDGVIQKQDAAIKQAQRAIDAKLAANKRDKKPKSDAELAPALARDQDARAKAEAARKVAVDKRAELAKQVAALEDARAQTRALLRERTQVFAADFLRACDLDGTCRETFTYVLVELDAMACAELARRFADGVNPAWDGALVLPGKP